MYVCVKKKINHELLFISMYVDNVAAYLRKKNKCNSTIRVT
jgi:hypothetical protein